MLVRDNGLCFLFLPIYCFWKINTDPVLCSLTFEVCVKLDECNALTMLFPCINDLICQVALGWATPPATLQVQIARPHPKHQWTAPYFPQEGTARPLEAISRHEHPHDSEARGASNHVVTSHCDTLNNAT